MDLLDRYLEELYSDSLMNNYEVRPSQIHGNGAFAKQSFKRGHFINTHFDPGEKITDFGANLNHSSNPCASSTRQNDDSYKTHAIKDIKKGDEITLDYTNNKNLEQPQKGWK